MKAYLVSFIVIMTLALACREEFHPLAPPTDQSASESVCKAPLLKQNIIGQWSFQTNIGVQDISMPMREGVITFSPDGSIIDPDSLRWSNLSAHWTCLTSQDHAADQQTQNSAKI